MICWMCGGSVGWYAAGGGVYTNVTSGELPVTTAPLLPSLLGPVTAGRGGLSFPH
jgi:hypothetical protein